MKLKSVSSIIGAMFGLLIGKDIVLGDRVPEEISPMDEWCTEGMRLPAEEGSCFI